MNNNKIYNNNNNLNLEEEKKQFDCLFVCITKPKIKTAKYSKIPIYSSIATTFYAFNFNLNVEAIFERMKLFDVKNYLLILITYKAKEFENEKIKIKISKDQDIKGITYELNIILISVEDFFTIDFLNCLYNNAFMEKFKKNIVFGFLTLN